MYVSIQMYIYVYLHTRHPMVRLIPDTVTTERGT